MQLKSRVKTNLRHFTTIICLYMECFGRMVILLAILRYDKISVNFEKIEIDNLCMSVLIGVKLEML